MSATFESGSLFSASVAVASAPLSDHANGLKVRALCAHEGQFLSQNGTRKNFTPRLLNTIATASNEHLESGEQTPLFFGNHDFDPTNKVGFVVGPYEGKVITETDLPDPKLTDLIGKYGIFTQIELLDDGAIAKYQNKLIKPISMSVDFEGERFVKNCIFEISLVGLAAFPGAQLFSKGKTTMKPDFKAMAAEALGGSFAVTMAEEIAEDEMMPKLYRLFEAFASVIRDILDLDVDDVDLGGSTDPNGLAQKKQELIDKAIQDLTVGIASRIKAPTPVASFSLDSDDDPDPDTTDPEEEDMSQIEELRAQLEEMQANQTLQEAYSGLHKKAGELVDKGYLTPALYESEFNAGSFAIGAIAKKFGGEETSKAIAEIEKKAIELNALEKFGSPVRLGSRITEPLEDDKDAAVADSFMSSYSIKSPLGKY
jgi:hypothetical protein